MESSYRYPGQELELFREAHRWKKYFAAKIKPFIGKNVLEAGAGLGTTTSYLNDGRAQRWTMLEPDEQMFEQLQHSRSSFQNNVVILKGTVSEVPGQYDTILYIDVLEHIEQDREEMSQAAGRLQKGGHLVVLSPAFNFLYSEFDKAIGHFKRYRKNDLQQLAPAELKLICCRYLDSLGFAASAMNKWVLHQSYPTKKQIHLWDRNMIPISRLIDPLFFYSFGKTILAVWQKQ